LGHGNPRSYYNEQVNEGDSSYADVFVKLSKYDPTDTPRELDQLRHELEKYPNPPTHVREFRNGPPITAPIAVRVIGPDLDRLHDVARKVEKVIEATPGTASGRNPW